MRNEIFVNVGPRETRVAVREADKIVELHIERSAERGVVGGVYKGKVTRVLPGMQAAFVDLGLERAGFLYVTDYRAELGDVDLDDEGGGNGRRGRGRGGPRGRQRAAAAQRGAGIQIQDVLEEGAEIVIQVAKEPLGTKGARITSRISLAGRHLVLMPWVKRVGVSRRIEGERERRRLRGLVEKLRPSELGFIVRTVSTGVTEDDLRADIEYLSNLWEKIEKRRDESEAPALLYEEPRLHIRVLRDLVERDTKQLVVDDPGAYGEMQEFARQYMASPRPKITHSRAREPLFDAQRIEGQIEEGLGKKVWLKSGGYLIIDQSEALTAIDVNTGRYTGGKSRNLEETILKTNLEAVRDIVHQLRFRNIGGLIILDLIDMEVAANREKVYRALLDALREDKSRVNILKISELGLIEMTRKRTRENLVQQLCEPCPNCEGRGYVQSGRTVSNKVFRELRKATIHMNGSTILVHAHPEVAEVLLGEEADALRAMEETLGRTIAIRPDTRFHQEQFEITAEGEPIPHPLPEPVDPEPEPEVDLDADLEHEPALELEAGAGDEVEDEVEGGDEVEVATAGSGSDRGDGAKKPSEPLTVSSSEGEPVAGENGKARLPIESIPNRDSIDVP